MALISGQSEWTTRAVREDPPPRKRERETQHNGLIARKMTIPVGKEAASGKKRYLFDGK